MGDWLWPSLSSAPQTNQYFLEGFTKCNGSGKSKGIAFWIADIMNITATPGGVQDEIRTKKKMI